MLRILTVDIGSRNCAFYVEEFSTEKLYKLPKIPKSKRYEKNKINSLGTNTSEQFQNVFDEVFANGDTILMEVVNLLNEKAKVKDVKREELIFNLTCWLDSQIPLWDTCCAFVIEAQFTQNELAKKLEQHVYSYFSMHYSPFKIVTTIPSSFKTRILGANKLDKPKRKKFAVVQANRIFNLRQDEDALEVLSINKKKADDVSDCVLHAQIFKYLIFVDKHYA